ISSQLVRPAYREYRLIQAAKTWNDAQAYCRANFDDLATVITNKDFMKIYNLAQTKQFTSQAWIGLYTDISGWHWSLGNESLG
ncbi:putative C-type lectin domain family 20 member A isoform X1, partial [Clarias magur]